MNNQLIVILGILFTFLMTTLGAAVVFVFKRNISPKFNTFILGFASGIMIAASIWSLLIPSINLSENFGAFKFVPAVVGFLIGGLLLVVLDKIVPNFEPKNLTEENKKDYIKITKLFIAITIHNIPEGLAVGFAFGAAVAAQTDAALMVALGLAIGIGIQNLPEGAAVSLPIKGVTNSKVKSFLFGTASGVVEPVFAAIGYFLATKIIAIQPWLLSIAAGAMIFVVTEELIPESKLEKNPHFGTWGVMLGFSLMMILDVVLA